MELNTRLEWVSSTQIDLVQDVTRLDGTVHKYVLQSYFGANEAEVLEYVRSELGAFCVVH
jgi:hypothetical protein